MKAKTLPKVFADTYAFFAVLDGATAYRPHMADGEVVTTALNALEFAYGLHRRGHGRRLDDLLPPILDLVVEPGDEIPSKAALFKVERLAAGARCSYVDAWGYATARSMGLPFLTGDEDFRGVPGVKFVKA